MKFCEKCGNLMVPKRSDDGVLLVCRECGHICKPSDEKYVVKENVKHTPKSKIVIIDNPEDTRIKLSKEELEERKKAILEFMDDE